MSDSIALWIVLGAPIVGFLGSVRLGEWIKARRDRRDGRGRS